MRRNFLLIFFCTVTMSALGQRYQTAAILKKADSLMISVVGVEVFERHYELDSSAFFVTKTLFNKAKRKSLLNRSKTNGQIELISVDYIFYVNKFDGPAVQTSVLFDKNLKQKYSINTNYLPEFVLNQEENNFMLKAEALLLAKKKFTKIGRRVDSRIYYNHQRNRYLWEVTNVIEDWGSSSWIEELEVDAESGEIINFSSGIRGRVH